MSGTTELDRMLFGPSGRQIVPSQQVIPGPDWRGYEPVPDVAWGSNSSELTETFQLPGGAWVNVPTIYGGRRVSSEEARKIYMENGGIDPETGTVLPTFKTMEEALVAAGARSRGLGRTGR